MQKFGTPLQDALRRDITINALFYNVHTRKVEDLSEKVTYIVSYVFSTCPYGVYYRDSTTCTMA
jgi:hypothetical protein